MSITSKFFNSKYQKGISLIEVLITLVIAAMLLVGVISMFISNKTSFKTQENLNRIQESARFVSEILKKDIRSAGYFGCNNESTIKDNLNSITFFGDYTKPIEGINATNSSSWHSAISVAGLAIGTTSGDFVRGGTDILIVRRASDDQQPLVSAMSSVTDDPTIASGISPVAFSTNDIVIIGDCKRSTIFQATGFTPGTGVIQHDTTGGTVGNSTLQLLNSSPPFSTDANVMQFQTTVFFVGTDTNGNPALRRKINGGASEILVSGVENMQIQYGLDIDATPDGIANRYVAANNVASSDWINVVSARVALLMQSPEMINRESDTTTYSLLDEDISNTGTTITHSGNKFLRQVIPMTIDIRNL